MWACKVCGAEYEPKKTRCIACAECSDKALTWPPQALSPAQRLWGKCYESEGHWEYGSLGPDGRPLKIMLDGRQKPAAQVALYLSGSPRPTIYHVGRPQCGNRACVRPDHLHWIKWAIGSSPLWAHSLSTDELREMLATDLANRAKYQRTYRRRLKALGVRSIRELEERRAEAEAKPRAPEPQPESIELPAAPEPAAASLAPQTVSQTPEPPAVPSLLASLAGAKIAPVD